MEILFEVLVFWPLFSVLEAVAGMLWPSSDPAVHRLQRVTIRLVLAGMTSLAAAIVLVVLQILVWSLAFFAVAHLCFIAAGFTGRRIEEKCKRKL